MGKASPSLGSFAAGEFAPQLEGRVDVDKYSVACHVLQNFIPLKQGPATFRPGSAFVQPVKSDTQAWLRRFEFSQTQAFVIEFGDLYCRFYTNHGPLLATAGPNYNSGTAYVPGNMAYAGGVQYLCIANTTGNAPPNSTYWYALASYNGSPNLWIYEIPSPYAGADLTDSEGEFTLQIVQSGDVLYLAGGNSGNGYPPYTLTRFSNAPPNWQFAQYSPTDGPFSDAVPLIPGSEIALSISAVAGQNITIRSWGGNVFAATDVGRLVRIGIQYFSAIPWTFNVAFTAGQICANNGHNYQALNSATTQGSGPLHTAGTAYDGIGGVLWLYIDSNYGVAQITSFVSGSQVVANVLTRFPPALVATVAAPITGITQANPAVVTATQSYGAGDSVFIYGVGGMTQVNQVPPFAVQSATGTTLTLGGIDSTGYTAYTSGGFVINGASTEWQLGAWSNTTEWPRAVTIFKDRLMWAGKLKIWGSVPGLYTSQTPDQFGQQTTDSALNELVSGTDASNICWLVPGIILLIGTEGGEYGLDAANYATSPLGPTNVEILRQSNWRCRHIAPELVGVSVLYVQRAGRKVFAMDYNFYLNRYDSTDQSKYAYHITTGGLTQIAYQQEPWSILWATRADGTLLSYTFNREDNVTAWARHNLGGGGIVESIAVIPAPDGLRDELWMIVRRTIQGVSVRYVEYLSKPYEGPQAGYAGDAQSSAWYLDCATQGTFTGTSTVTGLSYLAGQTVGILANGGKLPEQVVPATGVINLPGTYETVLVGLPYQGNLVPMRPEGGADVGTAQGKIKQGVNLVIRLVDALGGMVGQLLTSNNAEGSVTITAPQLDPIFQNYPTTLLDNPPPFFSGDKPISFNHTADSDQDQSDFYVLVQQNDPYPMTVVGLYPSYQVSERQ